MTSEMNRDQARDQVLRGGAGDENRICIISLGMSAGSAMTSIAAGRPVSSPVRECPPDALVVRSIGHAAGTPTAPEAVSGQPRELPKRVSDSRSPQHFLYLMPLPQ